MQYTTTPLTTPSRQKHKVSYDQQAVFQLLDEAYYCTFSYSLQGQVVSMPTMHIRQGEQLFVHGSSKSHFLQAMPKDQKVCISLTLLDGLVLAHSAFGHSMNYRSVLLFSQPEPVKDEAQKLEVLKAMINKARPGRWEENIRKPSEGEMKATSIFAFSIEEVSHKMRQGPPNDSEEDQQIDVWTGVIPLQLSAMPAIEDQ
jgi:nitroimidazol reductase NimA-like FMN-containing flavoprotein (pyridoxamine 5'-phosphate oxidase superfamily)